jgi:endonuclease YncB( thermonuclease family)
MDLTAGAKVHCKAIQETTSCTIAKYSADGIDRSRNMIHTGLALGVDHQFNDVQESAKSKTLGLFKGSFDLPSVSQKTE